jgi:hypothetical protein
MKKAAKEKQVAQEKKKRVKVMRAVTLKRPAGVKTKVIRFKEFEEK